MELTVTEYIIPKFPLLLHLTFLRFVCYHSQTNTDVFLTSPCFTQLAFVFFFFLNRMSFLFQDSIQRFI